MKLASSFTPEVMLSAPRRSTGVPNSSGTQILYTVSTYSFTEHSKKAEIRVLDAKTSESQLVTEIEGASEPNWLDDETILMLQPGEKGSTKLVVGKMADFQNSVTVGIIQGQASNIKLKGISNSEYALVLTAPAKPDGSLFNPETEPAPTTSGRLYKSMFVRHWDTYVTPNRNSLWYGKLCRGRDDQWGLTSLTNALKETGLECPIPPFGGGDHFDISTDALIFVAKDPSLDPATNTKSNVYLVQIPDWTKSANKPIRMEADGMEGASTSPVFSQDGKQAAFLTMKENGYESDQNVLFIVSDVQRPSSIFRALAVEQNSETWNLSPQSATWSFDGEWIYLLAESKGRVRLFRTPTKESHGIPECIFISGTLTDVRPLENGHIFISGNSLIDNSTYYLLEQGSGGKFKSHIISSSSRHGVSFGLWSQQISEASWPPASGKGADVHAWIIRPSKFNSMKKYPLAYLIHGGPQGAWTDGWSTRWNPAVFAEQGYVVVCPNPTGSSGYGQEYTDAIKGQWGGLPYQDLVNGFSWIEQNLPYVDTDRAVALGASYGGYMMNWIQGQPLGRKFKALVTHDGCFSVPGQMASEELYFPHHEFKGWLWKNREGWSQWDPSRFVENWATPHLVIHSELDYRLTISEGLAVFHALQAKGIESQFLMFPDENHWVLKPENALLWQTVVLDWINKHVDLPLYSDISLLGRELKRQAGMD